MQQRALQATTDELFVGGAKGPGKSDVIVVKATWQVNKEAYKALILRETYPELQELMDRSHRLYPRLPTPPAWSGELRRWIWPNRTIVKFGYCSRREDVQAYQGGEWALIGFDELGNHKDPRTWIDLLGENRCPNPEVLTQAVGSGNPGFAGHMWTKRRFVDTCGKNGERVHFEPVELPDGRILHLSRAFVPGRVWDNPVYANSAAYMGRLASLPEVLRRQRLFGDYDAGTGAALDELDESVHICRPFPIPAHWPMYGAFDWGYAHWWVLVVCAVTEGRSGSMRRR